MDSKSLEVGKLFGSGDRVLWEQKMVKIIGIQKDVQYLVQLESEGKIFWINGEELSFYRKPNLFDLVDEELKLEIPRPSPRIHERNNQTLGQLLRNFRSSLKKGFR
jgi:hypothetical protein